MNGLSINISQSGPAEWSVSVGDGGTDDSKLVEPMVYYASFIRKMNGTPDYPTGRFMMSDMGWNWTQRYMGSPSVFNWYLPDDQPAGDMVDYTSSALPNGAAYAPEFMLYTAVVWNRLVNRYRWDIYNEESRQNLFGSSRNNIALDLSHMKTLASDPEELFDYLNIKFAKGNLSDEFRQQVIDIVNEESSNTTTIARAMLLSVLAAPETLVNR